MAPSAHSTLPPAYWQAHTTQTFDTPISWQLYIGPPAPAGALARLALYYDPGADYWTWEISLTATGADAIGYRWGNTFTWQRAEHDALAALAALLHPAETFLPTTFLPEKAL